MKIILVLVSVVIYTKGVSQSFEVINRPSRLAPFIIYLTNQKNFTETKEELLKYTDRKRTSFVLINGDQLGHRVVVDSINHLLNTNRNIDIQRVYLVIKGDVKFFKEFYSIGNASIFSSKYFLFTDSKPKEIYTYITSSYQSTSLKQVVDELSSRYLWQIRLSKIKNENVSDLNKSNYDRGMTFKATTNVPFHSGFEKGVKATFRTFSIGSYRRWNDKWQTNLDLTVGANRPGTNKIRRQIENSGALSSGNKVEIDIKVHFYVSIAYEARRFLNGDNKLNPYVGFGVGLFSFAGTANTIKLDPRNFSEGEGPGNFADQPFDENDFDTASSRFVSASSGFQYTISEFVTVDFGVKWNQDMNTFKQEENVLNNLNIYMGFNFRFSNKKLLFYDYVH